MDVNIESNEEQFRLSFNVIFEPASKWIPMVYQYYEYIKNGQKYLTTQRIVHVNSKKIMREIIIVLKIKRLKKVIYIFALQQEMWVE